MKTTNVFSRNLKAFNEGRRYIINQGGTRSSKTFSIEQLLYLIGYSQKKQLISVVSETLPHLKRGAIRDFEIILEAFGSPHLIRGAHNKTDNIYTIGSSQIEFFSADNAPRLRGAARDYLFINEANGLSVNSFNELDVRTRKAVFIDFNPTAEFYVHDQLIPRLEPHEYAFIKSTYLDNSTLEENQIRSIESRRETDPEWWQVYGLGEIGASEGVIYPYIRTVDLMPEEGEESYGLDFGFNNPACLMHCRYIATGDRRGLYMDELIYRSQLTNPDLVKMIRASIGVTRVPIYADPSRPEAIAEIKQAGYQCHPAHNAVYEGIMRLKSVPIYITKRSLNAIKEHRSYMWKRDKNGRILEEPAKVNDHSLDAGRYGGVALIEPSRKIKAPEINILHKRR